MNAENKYKLSVLVPGIRPQNWQRLYDSVDVESFEMIFVGPYPLPESLKDVPNVKYIEDWGTPIRCQQIALTVSSGEYVTWAADDGAFVPGALGKALDTLKDKDGKTLVMGKYIEGGDNGDYPMTGDDYYRMAKHNASSIKAMPDHYLMLNVGVVPRSLLIDSGGWDCLIFEVCPMSYNDLAIRLQNMGVKFIIQNEVMFTCSHMPGHEGDHGPIHDAQTQHDEKMFRERYQVKCDFFNHDKIALNNWTRSSDIWHRRFKNGKTTENKTRA